MPLSPQPRGTMKRPPMMKSDSSSSSLSGRGLEQAVPSFQTFAKRTPPPDQQKPLPPTPLRQRRRSSFSDWSETPRQSRLEPRRSSSIYSRTPSQWAPDDVSWQSADFASQPDLLLRAIAYSASTPQLVEKQPAGEFLEPRQCSPLIASPSPTASRVSTPSPAPVHRPSVLLPPPTDSAHIAKKHLRTVSLEKAKAALLAPGAEHLLPEELRARQLGKSRSHEPLARDTADFFRSAAPPQLPEPVIIIDCHGRDRIVSSPRVSMLPVPSVALPDNYIDTDRKTSDGSIMVGNGPPRTMVSLANQSRKASKVKVAQALGLDDLDEPRGRTKQRGPRNLDYSHYLPTRRESSSSSSEDRSDAQRIAKEYHSLLSEQYRQPTQSPAGHGTDSDTSVREHMKMVPQPLFHSKPPAKLPGEVGRQDSIGSVSPFGMPRTNVTDFGARRRSSALASMPLRISISPQSSRARTSTSGSIPISPPSAGTTMSIIAPRSETIVQPKTKAPKTPKTPKAKKSKASKASKDDKRSSAYYPYVASRQGKNGKAKEKRKDAMKGSQTPPLPLLAADIIAQRLKTPERTPDSSPLRSHPPVSEFSIPEDASIETGHKPLHRRIAKGAVKYADLLTRPAGYEPSPERLQYQPITYATISQATPESPHLLPSPSSSKTPSLGWSDMAKSSFDKARSSVLSSRPPHPSVLVTHTVTAARPLDESKDGLNEPESPGLGRKGSIFGNLMDFRREAKAEKRRTDLKKMIKHVPQKEEDGGGAPYLMRRLSSFGLI